MQDALSRISSHQQPPAGSNSARGRYKWSRVLPRRRKKPQQQSCLGQDSTPSPADMQTSPRPQGAENAMSEGSYPQSSTVQRNRSQVPGARKIWGTQSSATTRAVSKTITTLTKVSNSSFTFKRKFKMGHHSSANLPNGGLSSEVTKKP